VPHYRAYTLCGGACADAIGFHTLYEDPEDGETIDIKAGDTVYFDNNSKGTWEVLETVRKAYLTFKRD
jgi:hypothetical protein